MRIEAKNVSVVRGRNIIFDRLSLIVNGGEIIALRGANGCGKTTLLRALAGLMPVSRGEVLFDDTVINAKGKTRLPNPGILGFAFQDGGLWPHMRVARHLDFVLRGSIPDALARCHRVDETLAIFRLDTLSRKRPHELSGGEQQRLSLARALVVRSAVLLLDEAFVHLDAETRDIAAEQVLLRAREGAAVIATAHDALPFQPDATHAFSGAGLVRQV